MLLIPRLDTLNGKLPVAAKNMGTIKNGCWSLYDTSLEELTNDLEEKKRVSPSTHFRQMHKNWVAFF